MYEAQIRITEKDLTWSELKAFIESKKLRIISIALTDEKGLMDLDSSIVIPPDAQRALHFRSAETDLVTGATEVVSETAGYIDAESREITKKRDIKTGIIKIGLSQTPENQVHGIRSGGT